MIYDIIPSFYLSTKLSFISPYQRMSSTLFPLEVRCMYLTIIQEVPFVWFLSIHKIVLHLTLLKDKSHTIPIRSWVHVSYNHTRSTICLASINPQNRPSSYLTTIQEVSFVQLLSIHKITPHLILRLYKRYHVFGFYQSTKSSLILSYNHTRGIICSAFIIPQNHPSSYLTIIQEVPFFWLLSIHKITPHRKRYHLFGFYQSTKSSLISPYQWINPALSPLQVGYMYLTTIEELGHSTKSHIIPFRSLEVGYMYLTAIEELDHPTKSHIIPFRSWVHVSYNHTRVGSSNQIYLPKRKGW